MRLEPNISANTAKRLSERQTTPYVLARLYRMDSWQLQRLLLCNGVELVLLPTFGKAHDAHF